MGQTFVLAAGTGVALNLEQKGNTMSWLRGLLMYASFPSPSIQRTRAAWLTAARQLEARLLALGSAIKFSPSQPRGPAGDPNGGQWVGADITLIGGIDPADRRKSVQAFISEKCHASIYSVLPGQFLEMPIIDVMTIAKSGNWAARRCLKLLGRDDYRK